MKNKTIIFAICIVISLIYAQVNQAKPVVANLNTIKVKVIPHGTYAEISVDLAEGAVVLLQVGKQNPPKNVTSGLHPKGENITDLFNKGDTVYTRVLTERNEAGGFATHQQTNTLLPNGDGALKQDTNYWYVVQVIEKGGKRIETGMFKTQFRLADIYITEIHIINDSDKSGDGEISFNFFLDNKHVNKLPYGKTTYSLNDKGKPLKFGSDFKIETFKNYADSTLLTVEGWDDDTSDLTLSNCGSSGVVKKPDDQNGEDKCGEWSVTSKKINFTYPKATGLEENFDKSYVLHAIGGNGSELEFEVYVTVKVYYLNVLHGEVVKP
jgi:hypothetical protein